MKTIAMERRLSQVEQQEEPGLEGRTFLLLSAELAQSRHVVWIMELEKREWREAKSKQKWLLLAFFSDFFARLLIELCLKVHSTFELGWAEELLLLPFFPLLFFGCSCIYIYYTIHLHCVVVAALLHVSAQCVGVSLWSFSDSCTLAYYRFFMPMCGGWISKNLLNIMHCDVNSFNFTPSYSLTARARIFFSLFFLFRICSFLCCLIISSAVS